MNNPQYKARILIADDDPVSRNTMEAILQPEGYTVFTLSSGVDLMEALPAYQPDVLLLDVLMPEVSGLMLCERIRADVHWQHLPIILVTSLSGESELVGGLDAGADDFISKPVNTAELRARVRSMVRVRRRSGLLARVAEMRSDLANMAVHDLRNPLASCLLRTDIMLRKVQGTDIDLSPLQTRSGLTFEASLRTIKRQLEGLSAQVDDILLVARTDEDELTLDLTRVDLRAIVYAVAEEQIELIERQQIVLKVETPGVPLEHAVDVGLVTRLIGNLIGNAVKFSPPNSTVTLKLMKGSVTGVPSIEVTDEGSGVPRAERKRIFDRYAIATAQKKGNRNYGLGLAFCKMVAEAHGGSICVGDNHPRGAAFRVRF